MSEPLVLGSDRLTLFDTVHCSEAVVIRDRCLLAQEPTRFKSAPSCKALVSCNPRQVLHIKHITSKALAPALTLASHRNSDKVVSCPIQPLEKQAGICWRKLFYISQPGKEDRGQLRIASFCQSETGVS